MTDSVWTEGDTPMELRVGNVWKARIPPEQIVRTFRILELGQKTVTLMEMPFSHIKRTLEISRVSFVERADD